MDVRDKFVYVVLYVLLFFVGVAVGLIEDSIFHEPNGKEVIERRIER